MSVDELDNLWGVGSVSLITFGIEGEGYELVKSRDNT